MSKRIYFLYCALLLCGWSSRSANPPASLKPAQTQAGTLITSDGAKIPATDITLARLHSDIPFYLLPDEQNKLAYEPQKKEKKLFRRHKKADITYYRLSKDPAKDSKTVINLADVADIRVAHARERYVYCQSSRFTLFVEVEITFSDENQKPQRLLLETTREIVYMPAGRKKMRAIAITGIAQIIIDHQQNAKEKENRETIVIEDKK